MPNQPHNDDPADLKRTNAELSASLERCRRLLEECRSKLASKVNNEPFEEDRTRTG